MREGGTAMDAVVQGTMVSELSAPQRSVGLGGMPDRDGIVTLDAAVMNDDGRAGSVACVRGVQHPVLLARMVMERTQHVMLVGEGAQQFARDQGVLVCEPALDAAVYAEWQAWLQQKKYAPVINVENHDTISMIAMDANARMAVASTTSGLAFKMHGRVGDSPIIGAGLFVESEVGAAVCTGLGEVVMRRVGAHAIVQMMQVGATPQQACEDFIRRMIDKVPAQQPYQVGVLAMNYKGNTGAYAVRSGFTCAIGEASGNALYAVRCCE